MYLFSFDSIHLNIHPQGEIVGITQQPEAKNLILLSLIQKLVRNDKRYLLVRWPHLYMLLAQKYMQIF